MVDDANFPDDADPRPPVYVDKQDALSIYDLNWLSDVLTAVQTYVGEDPGDRSTDMSGTNFGSLGANFRALCRIKTGHLNFYTTFIGVVTVDGEDYVYFGSSYFLYYKLYFLSSQSDALFTEPPLFLATCRSWTAYAASSNSGANETLGAWRTTRSYVQVMGHGVDSLTWTTGDTGKDHVFDWIAIQPPHGRTASTSGSVVTNV